LARVKRDLRIPLERAGVTELIGEDMLFLTLPVAEEAYVRWATNQPGPPGPPAAG
jgi:SulP family sulfate permease